MRTTPPPARPMREDSPVINSTDSSCNVLVRSRPKAEGSMLFALRYRPNALTLRPMGAGTKLDASAPCCGAHNLTCFSRHSSQVSQKKNFVLRAPLCRMESMRPMVAASSNLPPTTCLRYTVRTPGYDGDSSSSSNSSMASKSKVTSSRFTSGNSMIILSAALRTFSCGRFFFPGIRLRSDLIRPSSCSSAATIKYLGLSQSLRVKRTSTTSTTRTRALCFAASIINRDAPLSNSSAKRSRLLAVPFPNADVSMPCASNIWPTATVFEYVMVFFLHVLTLSPPPSPVRLCTCTSTHSRARHSKVRNLSAILSTTKKTGPRSIDTGVAFALSKELSLVARRLCSLRTPSILRWFCIPSRRSTSSKRRAATAGSGPSKP
mmetsp:Transcript_24500/g.70888  ORF Transcript_24500/g.70888 Transcript_24500/m.70888 type:complete len:377 (-) Transcript_24500:1131-2261(-)